MRLSIRQSAYPNLENLMAAGNVDWRHEALPAVRERLNVGVVTVIESARAANDVEQSAGLIAMFTEPRVCDPQRVEIALAATDRDWKPETDRGIRVGFIDEDDLAAFPSRRLDDGVGLGSALG